VSFSTRVVQYQRLNRILQAGKVEKRKNGRETERENAMNENNGNVVKVGLVIVNGSLDFEASLAAFNKRVTEWQAENVKADAAKQRDAWIVRLTQSETIKTASDRVLAQWGQKRMPVDAYVFNLVAGLSISENDKTISAMDPDLMGPVKEKVLDWIDIQKTAGLLNAKKGKSGGIKASEPMDLAAAAE
jgi:hypothetical protein